MATNSDAPRIVNALIGVESGGRFDALGPVITNPRSRYYGDRAYGVSQIMGLNIPSWTRKYLGREMTPKEFLADRSAQLAVTHGFVNEHLRKGLTPDQVANVWFTGSATPRLDVSDRLGTTAAEYRRRFNERFGSAADRVDEQMGGLIGNMGQGQPQPQPQPQPQGGMFRNPDFWESLALASNTLRLEPDQGLAEQIGQRREARAAQQGVNRTVEYFASRGLTDLAQLAQIDPAGAMRLFIERQQAPQAGVTQMTGAQLMERFGVQNLDPNALFNISPDGKITPVLPGPTTIVTGPQAPSAGMQAVDKAYAERYLEWITTGGPDMIGQFAQLDSVLSDLERGKPLTGAGVGATEAFGDLAFAIMNPDAANARDLVYDVVQRNLRRVLGPQFTQVEGQQLVKRAYNPALPPEQNAARLRKLVKMMEEAAAANQSMAEYFEKNQTLMGYRGKMITKEDFFSAFPDDRVPTAAIAAGVSQQEWDAMTDKEKRAFME